MRKLWNTHWIITALLAGASFALALSAEAQERSVLSEQSHDFRARNGRQVSFLSRLTVNERDQREVVVIDELIRSVSNDEEAAVLYGRDTDADDVLDAWFLLGPGGVEKALDRPAPLSADGWEVSEAILRENETLLKERNLASVWWTWLSRISAIDTLRKAERTQMDLHELELRADRMAALDPRSEMARAQYEFLSQAWNAMGQEFQSKIRWHVVKSVFWGVVSGVAFRVLSPVLATLGVKASQSALARLCARAYEASIGRFLGTTKETLARLSAKLPIKKIREKASLAAAGPLQVTAKNVNTFIDQTLRTLDAQDKFRHALAFGLRQSWYLGRVAISKKTYVLQVQLIQLAIELLQRRKVLFELGPILLPERVDSGKELLQNLAFMTTESTFGAGISVLQHHSLAKRMAIAGVFSIANSTFWSVAVKQSSDTARVTVDTLWEVLIGNFQTTTLDQRFLGAGRILAARYGHPEFRLVGWALTYADQGLGYYFYNQATTHGTPWLQEKIDKLPPLRLIPILSP